jgi:Protein kinase domain/TIR domain
MASVPRVLLDRYEVGAVPAVAGPVEVHEGVDRRLGRRVAITLLVGPAFREPAFLERFERHALAIAALSHPNVVGVYDVGVQDGTAFLVEEHVGGRTLREVLRAEGPPPPWRAAALASQVAAALAAAHDHGLVHGNLAPSSIMVTPDWQAKVTGFAVAAAAAAAGEAAPAGEAVEVAQYLSPEQVLGRPAGQRSDLYSLGCVLYELLTGRPPFTGASPVAVAARQVREDPTPPGLLNGAVSSELEAVTMRALAKDPERRYQTATELRRDLEAAGVDRAGGTVHAPLPERPPQGPVRVERPGAPEPGQARPVERVAFTAAYPGVATPQVWYSLSVYVHLGRLQATVDELAAGRSRLHGLVPAVSSAAPAAPLRRGTPLRIVPEVPGVSFNPPSQDVSWLEDVQEVSFRLRAAPAAAGRALLGAVAVHAGPLLVAQVPLSIHVRAGSERREDAEAATATAQLFGSVFASYAHEDGPVVKAFAEAYRALGIDLLVDKASLRAGERWQERLLLLIENADLFQLFWSDAASRSGAVADEWTHALSLQGRKGERFIRPVFWQTPWPPPPPPLAHLHFAALDLSALSHVVGR